MGVGGYGLLDTERAYRHAAPGAWRHPSWQVAARAAIGRECVVGEDGVVWLRGRWDRWFLCLGQSEVQLRVRRQISRWTGRR